MDGQRDGEDILSYRVRQLEEQQRELVRMVQTSISDVGAKITALSTQIGTSMTALPDTYAPRREAEERHRGIGERFDGMDRRFNDHTTASDKDHREFREHHQRLLALIIGALITALLAFAQTIFRFIPATGGT